MLELSIPLKISISLAKAEEIKNIVKISLRNQIGLLNT
jgi:hypothetical protein